MKVEECIKRFDNLMLPAWCDLYKDFIDSQKTLKPMGTSGGIDKNTRNVEGVSFSFSHMLQLNSWSKQTKIDTVPNVLMFHSVVKQLEIPLLNYNTMFKNIYNINLLQVDFLKYDVDGKYEVHSDEGADSKERLLTAIINLNQDYEGGDFEFYDPKNNRDVIRKEKLNKGSIMIFPSNFIYPHSVRPITKGKRYSLVCWMG